MAGFDSNESDDVSISDRIFGRLDFNGDGELDEEEFVKGCLADEQLIKLLNSGGDKDIKKKTDKFQDDFRVAKH